MIFKETISPQLSRAIKANTTVEMRESICNMYEISPHTLNSLLSGARKVTDTNAPCLIRLTRAAIKQAYEDGKSLTDYSEHLKQERTAEAAPSNGNKIEN